MIGLMHPALLKRSGWRYNSRMRDLLAARWWGVPTPGEFDAMDRESRLNVVALYEVNWRMDAVNAWEVAKEMKGA